MISTLRRILGLVVIASISALTFKTITGVSEARLAAARVEFERLTLAEETLDRRRLNLGEAPSQLLGLPAGLLWGASPETSPDLVLQKAVLDAARESGLTLTSFGGSSGPKAAHHPTVGFELEGIGGHVVLAKFLARIETLEPRLAVSYLWLRQVPPAENQLEVPVSVRMAIWAFRDEATTGAP